MSVSLVFLDLDGTIIGPGGGVSEAVWGVIDEALAAKVTLAACTGRTRAGVARDIAARLGASGFHIFDSGAIVASHEGRVLSAEPLGASPLDRLARHARTLGPETMIELYAPDAIYVEHLSWRCERHAEVLGLEVIQGSFEEVIGVENIIRAHWIAPPEELERALSIELDDCQVSVASSPALPESMFASITASGVSKGSAAGVLARELGVDLANAMAIGDSFGDLPVLEVVGHPRVMAEAPSELRERFKTLGGIEEDGVIEALMEAMGFQPG